MDGCHIKHIYIKRTTFSILIASLTLLVCCVPSVVLQPPFLILFVKKGKNERNYVTWQRGGDKRCMGA